MPCTEAQLEALFIHNPDFEKLEREFDVFCPFEAVGMVSQEVRHGHFLSYILDPQRPHGFGAECLRALLHAAAHASGGTRDQVKPMEAHLMRLDNARVLREWRKIDLLVELPEPRIIIAIELKIDANEHGDQLARYMEIVRAEWPEWRHTFLFLTKHGTEPGHADWLQADLDTLVATLADVLRRGHGNDDAQRLLGSYLQMLRRRHLNDEMLEGLAGQLWAQHGEALEFLMDQRPDAFGGLLRRLFESRTALAQILTDAAGVEIEADQSTPSLIRFAIPVLDARPGFKSANWTESKRLLLLELDGRGRKSIAIRFVLGRGDAGARRDIYDALDQGEVVMGRRGALAAEWSRLATTTVHLKAGDVEDQEKAFSVVEAALGKYAREHVRAYVDALMPAALVQGSMLSE